MVFRDRTEDLLQPGPRKRHRPIDLPDPRFIAIHAGIAGILHMSGAGKFFDELLDKYQGEGGSASPVRWENFELYTGVHDTLASLPDRG